MDEGAEARSCLFRKATSGTNISPDCSYGPSFVQRILTWSCFAQACVHRRAILSVTANPACPDEATAERAVNEVWDSCFSDTRPFDEVCYLVAVYWVVV